MPRLWRASRIIGLDFQGLLKMGDGLVPPPLLQQGEAEAVMGRGIVGLNLHGSLEVSDRLVHFPFLGISNAEVVVGLRELGFAFQRLCVGGDGFVQASLLHEGVAEVVIGHGQGYFVVVWDFQGFLELGHGFVRLPFLEQLPANVVQGQVAVGISGDGRLP